MASSFGIFSSANFAGVDQGVDFRGTGPIPALDKAVVTDVRNVPIIEGGSYPQVTYQLKGGPYRGSYVYVMENFTPLVKKGQQLKAGEAVGIAHGSYPYVEVGFAATANGAPLAPLYPNPHSPKPAGEVMWKYIGGQIGRSPRVSVPLPAQTSTAGAGSALQGVFNQITGGAANLIYPGSSAANAKAGAAQVKDITSTAKFIGRLTNAEYILRGLQVIGGALLALLGLYLLARQIGLGVELPGPLQGAGRESEDAARQLQQARLETERARADELRARAETRRASRAPRIVHQYYLEEPTSSRIRRRAAAAQPSEEIPF